MSARIRPELPADAAAISQVVTEAFAGHPHSDGSEARIVMRLRSSGALAVSLVAVLEEGVVGHVAFSPVRISSGAQHWYGLGPVAVLPTWRRLGIGGQMIVAGLARLRTLGAAGCVVLGDPAYYRRFGFEASPALTYPGPPPEYFQALAFERPAPTGVVQYASAFGDDSQPDARAK